MQIKIAISLLNLCVLVFSDFHTDTLNGFKVGIPKNWKVASKTNNPVLVMQCFGPKLNNVTVNYNISVEQAKINSLDSLAKFTKNTQARMLPLYKVIKEKKTKLGNSPAFALSCTYAMGEGFLVKSIWGDKLLTLTLEILLIT